MNIELTVRQQQLLEAAIENNESGIFQTTETHDDVWHLFNSRMLYQHVGKFYITAIGRTTLKHIAFNVRLSMIEQRIEELEPDGFWVADHEICDEDGTHCPTGKLTYVLKEPRDDESGVVENAGSFDEPEDAVRFVALIDDVRWLLAELRNLRTPLLPQKWSTEEALVASFYNVMNELQHNDKKSEGAELPALDHGQEYGELLDDIVNYHEQPEANETKGENDVRSME